MKTAQRQIQYRLQHSTLTRRRCAPAANGVKTKMLHNEHNQYSSLILSAIMHCGHGQVADKVCAMKRTRDDCKSRPKQEAGHSGGTCSGW